LVPVLGRDDEHAEHEGEEPRVVEHRQHVDEPLRGAVRDDPGAAAVSPSRGEGEGEAEHEIDHHDDAEQDICGPDRPQLAELRLEQPAHHRAPFGSAEPSGAGVGPSVNCRWSPINPAACAGCMPSPPVSSKNNDSSDSVEVVISCTSMRCSSMIGPSTSGVPPSHTT